MKNLKKVLALVLVAATLMGLAVSASAKDASDYKDYSEVTYNEAVDVMSAIGVFNGSNGSFNPKGILTREEAAKIITYMLLGQDDADKLVSTLAPYSDVPASRWSAGSIAYCANQGILAGVGNNKFNPAGQLTGLQFAKMILCALGFKAEENGLVGNSWAINASKLAIQEDLDKDMEKISLSEPMTREQACQMALNGVKWTDSKDIYRVSNGTSDSEHYDFDNMNDALLYATLMNSNNKEGDPTWSAVKTKDYSDALIADVFEVTVKDGKDPFGRPATTYEHDDWDGVLSFGDEADYKYIVDGDTTLAKILKDHNLERKVLLTKGNFDGEKEYKAGDVVEMYVDEDKNLTYLVDYKYTLMKITDVDECDSKADKDAIEDGAEMVLSLEEVASSAGDDYYDIDVNGYDKNGYVKDAYIVVAVNLDGEIIEDEMTNTTRTAIAFTDLADSVEGKVSAKGSDYVRVGGTKYTATGDILDDLTLNSEYTIFLDPNGMIIGSDVIDEATNVGDVLYVHEVFTKNNNDDYNVETVETYAQVVKVDGTVQNILVGTKKGTDPQYGLDKDKAESLKGGLYTAKYYSSEKEVNGVKYKKCNAMNAWPKTDDDKNFVATVTKTDLKSDATKVAVTSTKGFTQARLNSSTTYITIKDSLADIDVAVKTGGVKSDMAYDGTAICTETNGSYIANYVFLPGSKMSTSYSDVIYVAEDPEVEGITVGDDDKDCVQFTVYDEKGAEKEIILEGASAADPGFYTYEIDDDGIYTLEEIDDLNTTLTADYDDESGRITGNFSSYYGDLLTLDTKYMVDIDTSKATFIDVHDTDADGQYGKTIRSLSAMKAAADRKEAYEVSLDIYANNGAVLVVVTSVTATKG